MLNIDNNDIFDVSFVHGPFATITKRKKERKKERDDFGSEGQDVFRKAFVRERERERESEKGTERRAIWSKSRVVDFFFSPMTLCLLEKPLK